MKMKLVAALFFVVACYIQADGQHYKKDGTPDMRYKENKALYGNSYQNTSTQYTAPSNNYQRSNTTNYNAPANTAPVNSGNQRNYNNGGQLYMQQGYMKKDGTYVEPHMKTKPDNKQWNNYNNLYK